MAPTAYSIKDVEKLVKFDGKVRNVEVARLTAPGENCVSLVLRVDFEVEKNGHSKIFSSVAKRFPLSGNKNYDFHSHAMNNEIKWYLEIVPLLKYSARKNEIEMGIFPEYYGSRFSLNSAKQEADSDSVLLLENLIPQGYHNDDRYVGCGLNTSKAVLKSLALFHALPIAIKMKEPETFKILKDFLDNTLLKFPGEDGHLGRDKKEKGSGPPPGAKKIGEVLFEELVNIPDFAPYLSKIKSLLDQQQVGPGKVYKVTKEPWNTIIHTDFWVNNVMTKSTEGQEPLVKIVDFQMCVYGSYAKDLVFFLLSSIRNDVTKEYMDDLLRVYYDEFISILQKTKSGLELTYEDYLEEVRTAASESEISHALMFSTVMFGAKGTGVDAAVQELRPDVLMVKTLRNMNQYHKEKLVSIASEAEKRNWMKSF